MTKRKRRQLSNLVLGILLAAFIWIEVSSLLLYRDGGVVDHTYYNGPTLYIRLSDGRVFKAGACQAGIEQQKGNSIKFTAIRSPGEGPDPSTPVIIRCKFMSWALGTPLPN